MRRWQQSLYRGPQHMWFLSLALTATKKPNVISEWLHIRFDLKEFSLSFWFSVLLRCYFYYFLRWMSDVIIHNSGRLLFRFVYLRFLFLYFRWIILSSSAISNGVWWLRWPLFFTFLNWTQWKSKWWIKRFINATKFVDRQMDINNF